MTDKELMQQALDALESSRVFVTTREKIKHPEGTEWYDERIEALRARLEQGEQKPVAWWHETKADHGGVVDLNVSGHGRPLYFAPPQRTWIDPSSAEIKALWNATKKPSEFAALLLAKFKEKNS